MFKFLKYFLIIIISTLIFISKSYSAMNDYCITPPFIVAGVKPNLLMMLDNSASMYDLAYIAGTNNLPTYTCQTQGGFVQAPISYCYDNIYDNTKDYMGYFSKINPVTQAISYPNYSFSISEEKFIEVGSIPGGCTYSTSYLCINMTGSGTTRAVTQFVASGRFLNWLSASKLDVQKMILTGGKYDTTTEILLGESRGCVGKRFVKELPSLPGLTFAIRGPNALGPDYSNPDTQGGDTRIEIYEANYNDAPCQCAVYNWINGSYGQASTDTKDCLGVTGGAGTPQGNILATLNHSLQTCWLLKKNIQGGATTLDDIWQGVNTTDLTGSCLNTYNNICGSIYKKLDTGTPGIDYYCNNNTPTDAADDFPLNDIPKKITNESAGNWICTGMLTGVDPFTHSTPAFPYNLAGSDQAGYLSRCATFSVSGPAGNLKLAVSWSDTPYTCVHREILHYCYGTREAEVIDPSEGAADTSLTGNIPSVVIDAGIRALGDPIGPSGSTDKYFKVKVSSAPAPTGLIQEFSGLIRFGAMSFNCIGSASEPLPGTCRTGTNMDGGRILGNAYIGDPLGDHGSGIIKAIDDIQGMSWTPFAEGFYNTIGYFANRTNLRINETDFDETKNPVQYRCQKNNVLLITDGMSTADLHPVVNSLISTYNDGDGQIDTTVSSTCPKYAGSRNVDDLAWVAKNRDIKNFTQVPLQDEINSRTITTHVVFSGTANSDPGECNPLTLMSETAENGGTTLKQAENPEELYNALRETFLEIAGRAASGTAASVLASGEGSGANLVQAIFYPERSFSGTEIQWTGTLKNLWYHIDPFLGNSTIREDSDEDDTLILTNDKIANFFFDTNTNTTKANLFADSNGDGVADSTTPASTVYFENVKSLWEAGSMLWAMNPADRVIFTSLDGSSKKYFTTTYALDLMPYLQAETTDVAARIISYVRGTDYNNPFCSTTVTTSCTRDSDCPAGKSCIRYRTRAVTIGSSSNTWKLGDIINSTPAIVSWTPLNTYHDTYRDPSYKKFIESSIYRNRGMVFVGSNAGMLHAFKLGHVELYEEKYRKAALSGENIGREEWAFIPKNVLPYLRYLAEDSYCHLYYVDLTPYVFDASIGTTGCTEANYWDCSKFDSLGNPLGEERWKTILIGGMRLGGACRNYNASCTDCVKTPIDGVGYSSYFALDITNPSDPQVLWEFTHENLGYSTTGPAIVRISAKKDGATDNTKNGRWFVVVGSGPTGPIDTDTHQFMGRSDQNLRVFILDLAAGTLLRTIDSGIQYAFVGSMINSPIDFDQKNSWATGFYQDDAVYFGYTKAENNPPLETTKWNAGGVLRLFTKNSLVPADWTLSKVIDNIGPVTASVAKLQNYSEHKVRLFFGTGRYFYKIADDIDDADPVGAYGVKRRLYGLVEPCYSSSGVNFECVNAAGSPGEAATAVGTTDSDGWYINLDTCTNSAKVEVPCDDANAIYKAERGVTDPLATPIGAVFFTTTKPGADPCEFGGVSHLWAVNYKTGGAVSSSILRGKVLLQVSTGSIEEIDLKEALTERDSRRTVAFQGVAPTSQPRISVPHKPINKIIHIRER
jgi:type IV pilus assembly protein PilY1